MTYTQKETINSDRLTHLDGLRGIAVLMVVFYHMYARWPQLLPYGSNFANFPLFKYGFLGVVLFFLISGFVIFMTLEKSLDFKMFIKKRWLRLFPAMLIATILIYMTAKFMIMRPAGIPSLRDLLPGLSFIQPFFWSKILPGTNMLEGSFWTLFVEAFFYIIFGLSYYVVKEKSILILVLISLLGYILKFAAYFGILKNIFFYSDLFGFQYYCWFTAGALAYLFTKNKKKKYLVSFFIACLFSVLTMITPRYISVSVVSALIIVLFSLPLFSDKTKKILSNKFLVFFGFISYPLYLIHENAIIALTIKLGKSQTIIPQFLLPLIPLLLIIVIAYFIAKYIEPFVKKGLLVKIDRSHISSMKRLISEPYKKLFKIMQP